MMVRRRRTYSDTSTSYAAVGSTQAADVLIFPPAGFRSTQVEFKVGSGAERFDATTSALMTWGLQRGAHLRVVEVIDSDSEGYQGLVFNEFGVPIPLSDHEHEQLYSADGTPFLSAGTTVVLAGAWTPWNRETRHRVIYVIREERRRGFALGSLDEGPIVGEELFMVEWRNDDSVWSVVRSVTSIPATRFSWLRGPIIRLRQRVQLQRYARALKPHRQI